MIWERVGEEDVLGWGQGWGGGSEEAGRGWGRGERSGEVGEGRRGVERLGKGGRGVERLGKGREEEWRDWGGEMKGVGIGKGKERMEK